MKQRCGELDAENAKQHKIIISADAERLRQKKELDQVCYIYNNPEMMIRCFVMYRHTYQCKFFV